MWQWIVRLIGGWIYNGKDSDGNSISFGSWIAKRIWVVGIVLMVLLATNLYGKIMDKFFPPEPSVINVSGDYNAESKDLLNFGCSAWRGYLKIGIKQK